MPSTFPPPPAKEAFGFFQPEGLNLIHLLEEAGYADWVKPKRLSKLAFIVHHLLERTHRDERSERYGGFLPLNVATLRGFIGPRYASDAIELLSQLAVIERKAGGHSAGRFSRGYRLSEPYRAQPVIQASCLDAALSRKLNDDGIRKSRSAVGSDQTRQTQWEHLSSVTISPEAEAYLGEKSGLTSPQRQSWAVSISDLRETQKWFRVAKSSGRIFHAVAQCPKELRPFLRIEGEETAEVDIANAQPFFLLSLFPEKQSKERETFGKIVGNGRFYEELFEAMPRPTRKAWGYDLTAWSAKDSTDRTRFKEHAIQHVLYDVFEADKARPVFNALKRLSPWLASELARLRSTKSGSTRLAVEMQTVEANVILRRVLPALHTSLPECRPISVHDAIVCQRRFAQGVARTIKDATTECFGVTPTVKIKGA
jgi:hypothetical protein